MASHFKWYPSDTEIVLPFNITYSFPTQANKGVKLTPRIPPKTGSTFKAGNIMRIELPAQGYMNPANTTLEFDVTIAGHSSNVSFTRFQNNIQSIFQRARWLYGSMVGEDIIDYNQWVRCLTEWTSTNQTGTFDQTAISDGIGGVVFASEGKGKPASFTTYKKGLVNVRQAYIQGLDNTLNTTAGSDKIVGGTTSYDDVNSAVRLGSGFGAVPNNLAASGTSFTGSYNQYCTRRYQVNLGLGIFSQDKYIPLKWMASQFALEFTFEQDAGCLFSFGSNSSATPTYQVSNVNLIPEIVEFDEEYDSTFLQGLQQGGVPIKFASVHTYIFSTANSSNLNLQIQERSRSVKALFAVLRRTPYTMNTDSGATVFAAGSDLTASNTSVTLQRFQWRIGGRYFPGSPVECSSTAGAAVTNGATEAWLELQKALNVVGDYRLSVSANPLRWGLTPYSAQLSSISNLSELDYITDVVGFSTTSGNEGQPIGAVVPVASATAGNCFHGTVGSSCFAMSIDLETSSGVEISGLNAEEQSDISLIATYSSAQNSNFIVEVFAYFDMMMILRENNQVDLIY